jgi:hypothetical protein
VKVTRSHIFKALFSGYIDFDTRREKAVIGPQLGSLNGSFYTTYEAQVNAAKRKYLGMEKFGCSFVQSVVGYRSSFIAGNGIRIYTGEENVAEQEWIDKFLALNKLDSNCMVDYVTYGEIDGKALFTVQPQDDTIRVKFIPYNEVPYEIDTDPLDYTKITEIRIKRQAYDPNEYEYIKLGGLPHTPNNATNRLHVSLHDIEEIDRALDDWSKYRAKFGIGQLAVETRTWEEAEDVAENMKRQNFEPGMIMAIPGKFYYVEPAGSALPIFTEEIKTRVKKVSGVTGVPPHFFGFTDLLQNRSTSESLRETINATTVKDITSWEWGIWNLTKKAMVMHNRVYGTSLDPDKVEVKLQPVTEEQFNRLMSVYMPLQQMGMISKDTVQNMIPHIDSEFEREQMEKEQASRPDRFDIREAIDEI